MRFEEHMVDITENLRAELISVAHEMADAARAAILPHFRASGLIADNKSADAFDPVTIGDRAGETAMRDVLARRRPRDGILRLIFHSERPAWLVEIPVRGLRN